MTPTTRISAVAAIVGPVLLVASSVAWLAADGDTRGEWSGILGFWAVIALAMTLVFINRPLEERAPRAGAIVTALIFVGAAGGAAFGLEAAATDFFGIERLVEQQTPSAVLMLQLPGTLFPISAIATGALALRHRTTSTTTAALLIIGGILFPASRLPDIAALGIVADLVWAAALIPFGLSRLLSHRASSDQPLGAVAT